MGRQDLLLNGCHAIQCLKDNPIIICDTRKLVCCMRELNPILMWSLEEF